jgi:predicted acylesterase/phospholipase RssA
MTIEFMCFEGGGCKGYVYEGVMRYLSEKDIDLSNLKVISGSSIGAFTALCIVLGYDFTEFKEMLDKLALPNFVNFFTLCKALPNIFMRYGAVSTAPIAKLVEEVFTRKNIDKEMTFQELYTTFKIDLIMTGSNVNTSETKYFNYKNTPNMKVKDACTISMSYPILFTPTLLDKDYYCDGGLYRNLPFKYIDLEYEQHLNSVGIVLQKQSENYAKSRNIIEYLLCLINGLYNNSTWSDFENDDYVMDKRICTVTLPNNISSFYVTEEQKQLLANAGYNAIKKFLEVENTIAEPIHHIHDLI